MPEFMSEQGNLVTIAFLFSAVMAVVMGAFFKMHTQSFLNSSHKTEAIVENVKKASKGTVEYTIVFKDRNGAEIAAKLTGSDTSKRYKRQAGDRVKIFYKKDTPEVVRWESFEADMARVSKIMMGVAVFDVVAPFILEAAGVIQITMWP